MSDSRQPVLIYLDAYQICIAECLILIEAILPIILGKTLPMNAKNRLSVDVRRSETSLLKLAIIRSATYAPKYVLKKK